jgi:hypothetical protein
MTIVMSAGKTDDPGFIEVLNSILSELIAEHAPEQFWVIQVDNWFDHKWLGFPHSVKSEFFKKGVTIPRFAPNRVLGQFSFVRVGNSYIEAALPALPHRTERKRETNLSRKIRDFTRSGCFLWYSTNTVSNGRGSVMVYVVTADELECWFATFGRRQEWKLQAIKGLGRNILERWLKNRTP